MLYRNKAYAVYKRRDTPISKKEYNTQIPYEQFNGQIKVQNPHVWEPWIRSCRKNDKSCGVDICEFARQMIDLYKQPKSAHTLYQRAIEEFPDDPGTLHHYAEYLDFDMKDSEAAEQFYKSSIEKDPSNLRYIMDYVMYLDQVKGRGANARNIAALLNQFVELHESGVHTITEDDIPQMIKAAATLKSLYEDRRIPTQTREFWWKTVAFKLWTDAKYMSIQHSDVVDNWYIFEGRNLTNVDYFKHFFFY